MTTWLFKNSKACPFLLLEIIAILFCYQSSLAYVDVQTSTSFGFYRNYKKLNQFPVFHSWSLNGFYENGVESSVEFYLNNNFSENQWQLIPTQMQINLPLQPETNYSDSKLKVGRQLFSEGFDFALLDGLLVPYYLDMSSGIMPVIGYLRSTDFEQKEDNSSPLLGMIYWTSLKGIRFRGGYHARDTDFENRYIHTSFQYQWDALPWKPLLYLKQEFIATNMNFNQSYSELIFSPSNTVETRFSYTNLNPRPTNHSEKHTFIYQIFSLSPMETVATEWTWKKSEQATFNLSLEQGFYQSNKGNENSSRQDFSMDYSIKSGQSISPCFIHMKSYGGEIHDLCLRYSIENTINSKYIAELNSAYINKINQIEGWVQHVRGSYETTLSNRAKVLLALEVERNQYFIFDMRTMAYVTNYL
ncbi:MAG: hypothetical protein L6Q37_08975 [Bdellovibrionaceae bacterium]|nr:hypothetical protein [Pseudobdellovibrionaceae bacterium]